MWEHVNAGVFARWNVKMGCLLWGARSSHQEDMPPRSGFNRYWRRSCKLALRLWMTPGLTTLILGLVDSHWIMFTYPGNLTTSFQRRVVFNLLRGCVDSSLAEVRYFVDPCG
jgi:hypothetical protein